MWLVQAIFSVCKALPSPTMGQDQALDLLGWKLSVPLLKSDSPLALSPKVYSLTGCVPQFWNRKKTLGKKNCVLCIYTSLKKPNTLVGV